MKTCPAVPIVRFRWWSEGCGLSCPSRRGGTGAWCLGRVLKRVRRLVVVFVESLGARERWSLRAGVVLPCETEIRCWSALGQLSDLQWRCRGTHGADASDDA